MKQVEIFGEIHTQADRNRVEWTIIEHHRKSPFDYLLCEELGPYSHHTKKEQVAAIKGRMYSIGPMGLELAKKLSIPAIGIDSWDDETYAHDVKDKNGMAVDFTHSFRVRETQMVKTIKEYMARGRCAVIVGDSHLRRTKTKEFGGVSLLWAEFKNDDRVKIYRSPKREIE